MPKVKRNPPAKPQTEAMLLQRQVQGSKDHQATLRAYLAALGHMPGVHVRTPGLLALACGVAPRTWHHWASGSHRTPTAALRLVYLVLFGGGS